MTRKGAPAGDRDSSAGWHRYYAVVRRIPSGTVATYGQVAALAGKPRHARQVGYALFALAAERSEDMPWHRVINARGEISRRSDRGPELLQRAMLEAEGVVFDTFGRIDLRRFGWRPDV